MGLKTTDLAHSFRKRPDSSQSAKESGSKGLSASPGSHFWRKVGLVGTLSTYQKAYRKFWKLSWWALLERRRRRRRLQGLVLAVASCSGHHPAPTADTVARRAA